MKCHRMTLEIPDAMHERMQKVKGDTEAASVAEVVLRSFSLYEVLVRFAKDGKRLVLVDKDGSERELVIP
jgi:hypothetical protein